jgi:aryl-alcohol dehydrogenase-like predicted oxidoreductase
VYNQGRSEEVTGQALKRNGKRNRIVLATKVHGSMSEEDPNAAGNSRRHIVEQCEASLKRLRTDYIDLYQIHRPQSDIPIDETLRALDDLVRAGKVRYIGTSTFAAWQVMEAIMIARELGLNRFVSEQPPYSILDRRIERELIPLALTYTVALVPWSPLGGGLLTGKYRRKAKAPEGSRYSGTLNPNWQRRFTERMYDVLEALASHVQQRGTTMSRFALAWCMQQPGVTSPIIGPRTMEQFEDNLAALDVAISDEDRSLVDELVPPGRAASYFYEADFGPHLYR